MKIQVQVKSVFGVDKIYPVCDKAKHFAELTRKITLDEKDLALIIALGFDVEEVVAKKLELRK